MIRPARWLWLFTGPGRDFVARLPSAEHFGSWLGLCLNNRITGGKIYSVKTRVAEALRLGSPKAITALAHKLARVLWHLLKFKQAFNPAVFAQEEAKMKGKKLQRLAAMAAPLNYRLVPNQ